MFGGILDDPLYLWLTLAAILFLAELFIPGVFLVWIAIAAAITGLASIILPMNVVGQLTLFGVASIATVMAARRWYNAGSDDSDDPMLNDKRARLIGTTVTVVQPVTPTSGRVKIGDGEWSARGPELPVGAIAQIVDVEGGTVILETFTDLDPTDDLDDA